LLLSAISKIGVFLFVFGFILLVGSVLIAPLINEDPREKIDELQNYTEDWADDVREGVETLVSPWVWLSHQVPIVILIILILIALFPTLMGLLGFVL
jgi:hypothetical protein